MAMMLEFWKNGAMRKIYVNFDRQVMSLSAFLQYPEAKAIVKLMYNKIASEYTSELKDTELRTVGEFIHNHFLRLDKKFDVVVLGDENRRTVLFNVEDNQFSENY
ncbi:MAG: hypothetical protein A2014_07295 [Spirochaetes bacterium GWF1_49_6]|nr:MAG: hypothetical protein A2014_07295 [Spirochaetes bacterium GWF1_49_6]